MSKEILAKNERKAKRTFDANTINVYIGCIGFVLILAIAFGSLFVGDATPSGQMSENTLGAGSAQGAQITRMVSGEGFVPVNLMKMRNMTNAQRREAAVRIAGARIIAAQTKTPGVEATGIRISALTPGGTPDYFGTIPNFANSPVPTVDPVTGNISGGIRKFVDSLPRVGPNPVADAALFGANNLGQYMPLATGDTTTYNGSDYYEIALVEFTEKMHSDLNPTILRGYV